MRPSIRFAVDVFLLLYICNYVYPELTTVALGSEIAGEQAIRKLLSLLEGKAVESETVAPYLVERASVAEIREVT